MLEAIEDTELESTDTEVEEATYIAKGYTEQSGVRDVQYAHIRAERRAKED